MDPLNLGGSIGMRIDNLSASDPDTVMRLYVRRYVWVMQEKFVRHLRSGQVAVLVVQASPARSKLKGMCRRGADIRIEAALGGRQLAREAGRDALPLWPAPPP